MQRPGAAITALLALLVLPGDGTAINATLRGSRSSMERQNRVAEAMDYTFARTAEQILSLVEQERLVEIVESEDLAIEGASYPYARPEMKLFVDRLAAQYRRGCGERLVVTSLSRPTSEQPGNAHPLSVHPAGMAVDLRVSARAACRAWLEATLLVLEEKQLLDVTRERRPPHYHIAIYPEAYAAYVAPLVAEEDSLAALAAAAEAERLAAEQKAEVAEPAPFEKIEPLAEPTAGLPMMTATIALLLAAVGLTPLWLVVARKHPIGAADVTDDRV